jgi:AraC family transcriptional regulator
MIYFTKLPDHKAPGFNEQLHFSNFQQHNVVFNAQASKSHCDHHVGCLSIKTVLSGEEVYGFNGLEKSVRPGQFLVLNDDQPYSFRIETSERVKNLSVFFKREFAAAVFRDTTHKDEIILDSPFETATQIPEFFQTLYTLDEFMQGLLSSLIFELENTQEQNSKACSGDEHLVFLLHYLMRVHQSEVYKSHQVHAVRPSTKTEIYKRLCVAKDFLHSTFMNNLDLALVSRVACMSVPQLVRQFKAAFQTTPHQYLMQVRMAHAAALLKNTYKPVNEIARASGFENTSAFCRSFKKEYGITPRTRRAALVISL